MDLRELQGQVGTFVRVHGLNEDVVSRALDLASEVGELAKEVLRGTGYGKKEFSVASGFFDELGDVLFELLCLANATDSNLEEALNNTLKKMANRIDRNGHPGSLPGEGA